MAKKMKKLIVLLCLIPAINSIGQEIFLSRDTMSLGNKNYRDSIIIHNRGLSVLKIDSIKCINKNYALVFIYNNYQTEWKPLEEFVKPENVIVIQPNDSVKVRLSLAAILVKQAQAKYDQIDTMYLCNNSKNSPKQPIEITNKVIMGGVEDENYPNDYLLSQNYPNPFNPITKILFSLNRASQVVLKVYDNVGREVKELVNGFRSIGNYEVNFGGKEFSSGVYYYQLVVGYNSITRKMLLLK